MILSYVRTDSQLDLISLLVDFACELGQLMSRYILPMGYTSDSEQCQNRLQFDIISHLVNFSCELGQIMTRYDFLWDRRVILSNVRPNFTFGQLFM